jgi:hypothetical protein
MTTVEVKEVREHLAWRIKHDAVNSVQACEILGIRNPSLIAMIERGDIRGRMWDNRWWFPRKEVEKNILKPGEKRRGRPRHGASA